LRFRVPAEKPSVTTVRVDVTLPAGVRPVSYPALPGWTHTHKVIGATTHVVWTAGAGHEIQPDGHQYFPVRVGPLPHQPGLAFETIQTYSDGSVVNWNQPMNGGEEPPFPSPQLVLDAAGVKAHQGTAQDGAAPTASSADTGAASTAVAAARNDDTSRTPWIAAAAAAMAAAAAVGIRRRRTVLGNRESRGAACR
jgi:uncharacterized protein YcnI